MALPALPSPAAPHQRIESAWKSALPLCTEQGRGFGRSHTFPPAPVSAALELAAPRPLLTSPGPCRGPCRRGPMGFGPFRPGSGACLAPARA